MFFAIFPLHQSSFIYFWQRLVSAREIFPNSHLRCHISSVLIACHPIFLLSSHRGTVDNPPQSALYMSCIKSFPVYHLPHLLSIFLSSGTVWKLFVLYIGHFSSALVFRLSVKVTVKVRVKSRLILVYEMTHKVCLSTRMWAGAFKCCPHVRTDEDIFQNKVKLD